MIKQFKLFLISIILISSQVGSQNSDGIPTLLTEKPVDNYLLKQATINFKPYDEEQKGKFYMSKF